MILQLYGLDAHPADSLRSQHQCKNSKQVQDFSLDFSCFIGMLQQPLEMC